MANSDGDLARSVGVFLGWMIVLGVVLFTATVSVTLGVAVVRAVFG